MTNGKYYKDNPDVARARWGLKCRAAERLGLPSPQRGSPWMQLSLARRKTELAYQRELEAREANLGKPVEGWVATPRDKFIHPQLPRIEAEQKKRYADADTAEARAKDGFVYVIYHDLFPDCVKIGKARNPNKRLADANTWCPEGEFKLHGAVFDRDAMSLERAVHAAAKARSTQLDGEWFSMNRWHAMNLIRKVQRDDSIDSGLGSKQLAPCRGHDLATLGDGGSR